MENAKLLPDVSKESLEYINNAGLDPMEASSKKVSILFNGPTTVMGDSMYSGVE